MNRLFFGDGRQAAGETGACKAEAKLVGARSSSPYAGVSAAFGFV